MQGEFAFPLGWGGARKGAGRRKSKDSGVAHLKRDEFDESSPVHVTMKLLPDLPSLRIEENFLTVLKMLEGAQKESFRIVHFTVQGDHLHLLVEAAGKDALVRGMTGLAVRISRGLNKRWERTGSLFADRYHSRVLSTPTEVRNVLDYIFKNRRKHAGLKVVELFDSRSSAMLFGGWKEVEAMELVGDYRPIVEARSWLVREGWMNAGGKLSVRSSPEAKRKLKR